MQKSWFIDIPELMIWVAYGVLVLFFVIILISVGLIFFNIYAVRREKTNQIFRNKVRKEIEAYWCGELSKQVLSESIQSHPELLIGIVVQILENNPKFLPIQSIHFFQEFNLNDLVDAQVKNLESKDWRLRQKSSSILPSVALPKTISPLLIQLLQDDILTVRLSAAQSLAKLKIVDAVPLILEQLPLPYEWMEKKVIGVLNGYGSLAIRPIMEFLYRQPKVGAAEKIAIAVLGDQKADLALPILIPYLDHADINMRIACIKSLGKIGGPSTFQNLLFASNDASWEIRSSAIHALAGFKNSDVIPILKRGLTDSVWWVRYNSALALKEMGEEGVNALRNYKNNSDSFAADMSLMVLETEYVLPDMNLIKT